MAGRERNCVPQEKVVNFILFYFIFVAAGSLWISGYYDPGISLINKINCHCIFFYKLI